MLLLFSWEWQRAEMPAMAMAAIRPRLSLPAFAATPTFTSHNQYNPFRKPKRGLLNPSCSRSSSIHPAEQIVTEKDSRLEYSPGIFDGVLLSLFRNKMVQEVGWDSEKPGYDGLIEVANGLMKARSNSATREAAVRILRSLFPPWLLELYQMLIAPLGGGKIAAMMVARVTALSCQWLMGPCSVNSVDFPDGTSWSTGVFVEKCKYLEESKCMGICLNTCKFPTQTFFSEYMGVPLLMEPNFNDYSCQFKFGVRAPRPEHDSILREPCLEICPNANRRREFASSRNVDTSQCPKA